MLSGLRVRTNKQTALGHDSRELRQVAKEVPGDAKEASQEPEMDDRGRPDRLRLLSSMYQKDSKGSGALLVAPELLLPVFIAITHVEPRLGLLGRLR